MADHSRLDATWLALARSAAQPALWLELAHCYAGLGLPSHAAAAIELGADAVLVNTAIAAAGDPENMALAFALAVRAAETAINAVPAAPGFRASATSPMNTFDNIV